MPAGVFAAVELCPEVAGLAAVCDEVPVCVLLAEATAGFAAGFAVVAGFAAGVELSVAAAGGVVDGFVADDCRAAAVPAKMKMVASTYVAMLGSFRMDLVWQRFGACANGVDRDVCPKMRDLPSSRSSGSEGAASR